MSDLILIGATVACVCAITMLAIIAKHLGLIVDELKDIRINGFHVKMDNFTTSVSDDLLDKIANKFKPQKKGKRNGKD